MTKDEALKMALEALEWSHGGEPMPTKEAEAIKAIRQALDEWTPADTAYRPDGLSMPVDRGAWSDVENATKWVDELRGYEPDPVAKVCPDLPQSIGWNPKLTQLPDEGTLLYTEPPKKEWVGLTDDEIFKADDRVPISIPKYKQLLVFGRILEVRLREKNNG